MGTKFRSLATVMGTPTGDKRRLMEGVVTGAAVPMPIAWTRHDIGGHSGAVTLGAIHSLEMIDGEIWADWQIFDDIDPQKMPRMAEDVAELRKLIDEGVVGLSIDPDDYEEIIVKEGEDTPVTEQQLAEDPDIRLERLVTNARIRSATFVRIPAFAETNHTTTVIEDGPIVASVSGDTDLPVLEDREREWDGSAARRRVLEHFTDVDGNLDVDQASRAFLWVDRDGESASNNDKMSSCQNSAHAAAVVNSSDSSSSVARSEATATSGYAIKENCPTCSALSALSQSLDAQTDAPTAPTSTFSAPHASGSHTGTPLQPVVPESSNPGFVAPTASNSRKRSDSLKSRVVDVPSANSLSAGMDQTVETRPTSTTATPPVQSGEFCAEHATGELVSSETTPSGSKVQPHTFANLPQSAFKLGFADVVDGELRIIPRGVAATAGGRGVDAADIPESDKSAIKSRICSLYGKVRGVFEDWPECPFDGGEGDAALIASMTAAMERTAFDSFSPPVAIDGPTPMTYDFERGVVYGHIYQHGVCHVGIPHECRTPPVDEDFRHFHVYPVETNEGTVFAGRITAGGSHPDRWLSLTAVRRAYDEKATVAYVRASVDDHGIFVCGPLEPGLDAETLGIISRRKVSGHWPEVGNEGEIFLAEILALAEGRPEDSEPGFPIGVHVRNGRVVGMTAALGPDPIEPPMETVHTPSGARETVAGTGMSVAEIFRVAYRVMQEENAKRERALSARDALMRTVETDADMSRRELAASLED